MNKFESPGPEFIEGEKRERKVKAGLHVEDFEPEALDPYGEHAEVVDEDAPRLESEPYIRSIEAMFAPVMAEDFLQILHGIETRDEAQDSYEREIAKRAIGRILEKLSFLKQKTDISNERYIELSKQHRTLLLAMGQIRPKVGEGIVDHT